MRGEQVALQVPAMLDQLLIVTEFILKQARETGKLNEKQVQQIDLAVDEIFSNIVQHGFGSQGAGHVVEIVCEKHKDAFLVSFWDDAPPYDPLQVRPISQVTPLDDEQQVGGWGLRFVIQTMDIHVYQHDGQRNCLTVGKRFAS